MASLDQLNQELRHLRSGRRTTPRSVMEAATRDAQTENERIWAPERQKRQDYESQQREERMLRLIEKERANKEREILRKNIIERGKRDTELEEKRKAKQRHDDYQDAMFGIDTDTPELANQFISKYGPTDVNPTFSYDSKTKQFKLTPGKDLTSEDMEKVDGKWQVKGTKLLRSDQVKKVLENFQSIEDYRASQKRGVAEATARQKRVKTGMELGRYKMDTEKHERELQQGLSDSERAKMYGYFVRDRASGNIDPDVTFDKYLSEAGMSGGSAPGVGIPERQQDGAAY